MDGFLRWLAALRDLPVEPGADLHVELAGFPSGGLGLLVILGLAGAIAIVWFAYVRDAHRLPRGRRLLLTGLRTLAVAIATLVLLDPQIVSVRRDLQPGRTLVLVDTSQSMALVDAFKDPGVAELANAWQQVGVAEPSATPRIELLRRLLTRDDHALLRRLAERNRVLVHGFAAGIEPLADLALTAAARTGDDVATAELPPIELGPLAATGAYTNIGGALRSALAQSGAANLAGVVLMSDGRRNLGAQGPEVARMLRNRGVAHCIVVPIGDHSPMRTLRILRVDAPEKVFQADPFTIRTTIESRGYDGVEFGVRLLRERRDAEPEVVATRHAQAGDEQTVIEFDRLEAREPGPSTWVVEIEPPELEARVEQRHLRRAQIEALAERTRVLLIAGGPTHEYRILRNLLTRDDTIEVACWLSSADPGFPQDGNVSLESLPATDEELASWDVFVLLDPDAERLPPELSERIARQVREDGAGLWWVCGEKFSRDALRPDSSTRPLAELLPVVPDLQSADESIGLGTGMRSAWRYEITPQGEAHPAMRIHEDRTTSDALWAQLPGFHFVFPVERALPGAQVLATHRKPRHPGDDTEQHVLIATHFVGAGRVLFTATDDTSRWRSVVEEAYDRLWVRGIRYLFAGRLNAGNTRLRLFVDEERIELGSAVEVVAELRDESFQPWIGESYELELRDRDGGAERIVLEPVEGAAGRYHAFVRPTATGWFRVEAADAPEGRAVTAAFEVVPAALEKDGPVDLAELGAIAAAPGGVLLSSPSALLDAVDAIPSATRIETFTSAQTLWDSWLTVALLLSVLALEWWLRKRSNLL